MKIGRVKCARFHAEGAQCVCVRVLACVRKLGGCVRVLEKRESAYPDGHSGQGSVINLLTSPAQPPEESPITLLGFTHF